MTPSTILAAAARILLPLFLLFSVFLLLRGHNEVGGGFVGGLVASAGFALYALSHGWLEARKALSYEPRTMILAGLVCVGGSGAIGSIIRGDFLAAVWYPVALPVIGKAGTPLIFDLGVYLIVLGTVMTFLLSLGEEH